MSITATTGVKIDGGSGSVDVSASGRSLKGTTAKLEGSASAEVKASGVLTIQGTLVKIN